MEYYHQKILKSHIKVLPSACGVPVAEVNLLKPAIDSVSFHRYGKELAITITGRNLWFCNEFQVGSLAQCVSAENTSQQSIQFNLEFEDINKPNFSATENHVKVCVWSHFSRPIRKDETEVKRKVCTVYISVIFNFFVLFV